MLGLWAFFDFDYNTILAIYFRTWSSLTKSGFNSEIVLPRANSDNVLRRVTFGGMAISRFTVEAMIRGYHQHKSVYG